MQEYTNILVIKLGALGDFIHMTGWYAAIRHRWPKAKLTLMTGTPFLKLAQKSGYFDDYIVDNRTWFPWDYVRIVHTLASRGYDLIVDLQMQTRTKKRYYALVRLWSKTGFCWAGLTEKGLIAKTINTNRRFSWGHETPEILDIHSEPASLSFCKANSDVLAQLPAKYVLLIPGCSPLHPYKRWPADSYRALALKLGQMNIFSVVLGTNAEKQEIETICKGNPKAVNFCNKSALLDIPEIAARSMAIIGNDTGPQHMAELGTVPAITLFCDVTRRSAIYRPNITNLVGKEIADISVDTVFNALQSLWHKA